jgi:outer membrane lipoprotein-sorting protein
MNNICLKALYCFGFIFFVFAWEGKAQNFTSVKDVETVQMEINKVALSIETIKSRFIQEKHLSFMTEAIVSEGLFRFKKENQLRWEYTEPFEYLILFNGDKIIIKDKNKTNQFDANSNAIFKQINDLMLGAIKGDLGKNKDFKITLKESAKQYLLTLKPQNEALKEYVSGVEIRFEKADLAVSSIKMIESTGDFTDIKFENREFNTIINESTFSPN